MKINENLEKISLTVGIAYSISEDFHVKSFSIQNNNEQTKERATDPVLLLTNQCNYKPLSP